MDPTIATFHDAGAWDRALYAFLAEKERRSGSRRTVEGYARMLRQFFAVVSKPPDRVSPQEGSSPGPTVRACRAGSPRR